MDKPNWLQDKLSGRYIWPIVCALLLCAIVPACAAVISSEDDLKRILDAFSLLFNAALTAYLGLVTRGATESRTTSFKLLSLLALFISFAAAVSAVVLAFFDGPGETSASAAIQTLLGPVQNYIFAAVLAGSEVRVVDCRGEGVSATAGSRYWEGGKYATGQNAMSWQTYSSSIPDLGRWPRITGFEEVNLFEYI